MARHGNVVGYQIQIVAWSLLGGACVISAPRGAKKDCNLGSPPRIF